MRRPPLESSVVIALALGLTLLPAGPAAAQPPQWRAQEIATDLNVVYAVNVADMNRDGKLDVVAINNTQLMWFEAPAWTKHVVFDATKHEAFKGKKDNVCFATHDIDGDGWLDVALGADWQPTNTQSGGSLHWLRRPAKNLQDYDAPWEVFPIAEEPTIHRMRWADVDGDRKAELLVAPLHGRGTKKPDWEGAGARLLVFRTPKNPATEPWPVEVANESMHIVHNLHAEKGTVFVASKEGASVLSRGRGKTAAWTHQKIGDGSFGEVKPGKVAGVRYLGLVEPWHGTALVALRDPGGRLGGKPWTREIVDPALVEGQAVGWGDFDRDGSDELVAGWRGKPFGVATYARAKDGTWEKTPVDVEGMAAEDVVVADLNGDKRPDLVAGGRATHNIRIYWNEAAKQK